MSTENKGSPELKEIITKAKELFDSIKKGVNKLIVEVSAKLPKNEEKSTGSSMPPETPPEKGNPEIKPEMPPAQPQDPVPPIKPEPPIVADTPDSKTKPKNDTHAPE
ncbi:MAG TPA: hypothetical protein VHD33_05130 [Legionellaceae bacterium]|nr:hypothetical protein [Legionellaceae bacterium]